MRKRSVLSVRREPRNSLEQYRQQLLEHPDLSYGAWFLLVLCAFLGDTATGKTKESNWVRNGLLVLSSRLIEERVRRESYRKIIRDQLLDRLKDAPSAMRSQENTRTGSGKSKKRQADGESRPIH